jgi:hypothetical protein
MFIGQNKEHEDERGYAEQDKSTTIKPIFSPCILMDVDNPAGRDYEKTNKLELIPQDLG